MRWILCFCLIWVSGFSKELDGLVLTSNPRELKEEYPAGITVYDLPESERLIERLEPFLGRQITSALLSNVKEEVLAFYREQRHPMVVVEIPDQEVREGIVALAVVKAKVEKVCFSGQKWFPKWQFEKQVKVEPGHLIVEEDLLNEVAWLNSNPFHRTQAIFSPGKRYGATQLELLTKDRFPVSPFMGIDNTGTGITGSNRLFGGVNVGNMFWVGDLFSYQYAGSDDFHEFTSNYVNYTSFLPWKHLLVVYGGYAKIHPNLPDFLSNGQEIQASVRYKVPLKPLYTPFRQEVSGGIDYKLFNSELFFVDQVNGVAFPLNAHYVTVTQLYAGYLLENEIDVHQFLFRFEAFGSPLNWLPHQSSGAYGDLRPHAKSHYAYARMTLGDNISIPWRKLVLSFLLRTQGATGPLLPSEQFGLGGYDTVRGYEEREFNADNAICFNSELRLSPIPLFAKGELFFLGFLDVGAGYNFHPIAGTESSQTLFGVGPGARLNITPYVSIRCDYGVRLIQTEFVDKFGRLHFSAVVRY